MNWLSAETRSKLRSTQILTSMVQLISELFQNSLDAGATHIDVGVNVDEWSCWVMDNGSGINKEDLFKMANASAEDRRYGTSKTYIPGTSQFANTFGFRGEALASIADLCCLEISSRTRRSSETWCTIVKGDKTLYQGPATRWRRELPGTVVYIRDAFYNLPVRRMSHPTPLRSMELLRQDLESFALAFPGVSFSARNENDRNESHFVKYPKTASPLAAFRHLFGRALVEHTEEINTTLGAIRLEGFLSLGGALSKSYQYLFVNRRLMMPCELHRVVNQEFEKSTFAKHALDELEDNSRSEERRQPRKTGKKPVYVLHLFIPPQQVDNCLEPTKSHVQLKDREAVMALLVNTVRSFLVKHRFMSIRPKLERSKSDGLVSSPPQKRMKIERNHTMQHLAASVDDTVLILSAETQTDSKPATYRHSEPLRGFIDQRRTLLPGLCSSEDRPAWIDKALQNNEAFHQGEAKIPIVRGKLEDGFRRIESLDLKLARVIGQVDGKFIACVLPGDSLVLVDQHAADERIRVERFIKEMEDGHGRELDPPRPILLTSHEARQLASVDVQAAFSRWGIGFEGEKESRASSSGYEQVLVNRIPTVVEEKILIDNELCDVVKAYLAQVNADGLGGRSCPHGLLELVKSKACRGAVMFNDILRLDQCQRLLSQLAETRSPFQCAHGRPSLVPIADFGTAEEENARVVHR